MNDDKKLSAARQRFCSYLMHVGKRCTTERCAVAEGAMTFDGHFSAEDLCSRIGEQGFHMSLATVYNTMSLLVEAGLVTPHHLGRSVTYERSTGSKRPTAVVHHHLVCTSCGSVREIHSDAVAQAVASLRMGAFLPHSMSVTIYGECAKCVRQRRKAIRQAEAQRRAQSKKIKQS